MASLNKVTGKLGENLAETFLINKGYQIIDKNVTSHWGELDIVAKKQNTIVFVEVKTRRSETKGKLYESITYYKIKHLKRTIQAYITKNHFTNNKFSLDVITVLLNPDNSAKEIKHYEKVEMGR
jgi:putative endonuclease